MTANNEDFLLDGPNNKPDKIAVFIYDSDLLRDKQVKRYTSILKTRQFNLFIYICDTSDISSALNFIALIEESHDKLFFYIYGHGGYHESEGLSYVIVGPDQFVSPYQLSYYFKFEFESNIKGFLVESCQSGHFVTAAGLYGLENCIAMTTSNKNEYSYRDSFGPFGTGEGYFSKAFFNHLRDSGPSGTGYGAFRAGKKNVSKDRYFLFIRLTKKQHPQIYIEPSTFFDYRDDLFTYN